MVPTSPGWCAHHVSAPTHSVDSQRARNVRCTGDATPHDLRRTAASHMTSIGISRLAVSKILNHAETGFTAVYDRHSYDAEKRAALGAWGARLEDIIGARAERSNIVRPSVAVAEPLLATAG
jgi:integrase